MFAIVVDSTSDIPVSKLQELGVSIVPLDINFGETVYVDGIELGPEEFYEKLDAFRPELPKTACPAPGKFEAAFREAAKGDIDGIVCVTLTGASSGTYNSSVVAAQACEDLNIPIRCVDSKSTAAVMSMMLEKALKMRDEGKTADECADHMEKIVDVAEIYVAMESIEYILKGGKIAEGGEGADSGLAMKPILTLRQSDGAVNVLSKPRGQKAQYREMANFVKEFVAKHPQSEIRFCQANSLDHIDAVKALLDKEGISYSTAEPGWLCSLIGVYFGNRSYAVCMVPAELL